MAEHHETTILKPIDPGDEIVISGISGRFPECSNMEELKNNLFSKVDMVTDDCRRWKNDISGVPMRSGKIKDIEKFDASYFGINANQANATDPMCRLLLECAYEAIVDAGENPNKIRGSNTGVFVASCFSESEKNIYYNEKWANSGYGIVGCSKAMLANRISYWFGLTGPSFAVDSACCSSLYAFDTAYKAIKNGQCDSALVGGVNMCLHPSLTLQFANLGVLSPDGRCKTFDADANGYVRSEAISIVYLKKLNNTKRIYATVLNSKINCDGFKKNGLTLPSSMMHCKLIRETYDECKISNNDVVYIEAHGTGTKLGDPEEINAINNALCINRTKPLIVGSVKTNLGHTEAASGIVSIAKIIIANETGLIPPNLHFNKPHDNVESIKSGKIKILSQPEAWNGGIAGICGLGFGGTNAHVVLKSNDNNKINNGLPIDDLPRIILVSGRTEEAVDYQLTNIENQPMDIEFIKLIHDIYADDIPGHLYRGYTILNKHNNKDLTSRQIEINTEIQNEIWFVFSGMGSQWSTMGKDLLKFDIFSKTISIINDILKNKNIDIYDILLNDDKKIFNNNRVNSFVGICSIQIGLVDLLTSLKIYPDKIIGHSMGELGCAYADGTLTIEQTILSAYFRGIASLEVETIDGSMASIGLGYEDLLKICPSDIEIACHNSNKNSTISGPSLSVDNFIKYLQNDNIFAKKMDTNNIAYHSRYINNVAPVLLNYLKNIIQKPKIKSEKWLSTSVQKHQWSNEINKYSSAEYFTNNFKSPVLFYETCKMIPNNAITIEISPHGILQTIMKSTLDSSIKNISLIQRNNCDNVKFFLNNIGTLYISGKQPFVECLYPNINLPVSRGTPMISPLIKWDHTDDWYVPKYSRRDMLDSSGTRTIELTINNDKYKFLKNYIVNNNNILPISVYLYLTWETFGIINDKLHTDLSVVFNNIKFYKTTILSDDKIINIKIHINEDDGNFKVTEDNDTVVTGIINIYNNSLTNKKLNNKNNNIEELKKQDIYEEFKLRGYNYCNDFQGINNTSLSRDYGVINWLDNWIIFLDNIMQIKLLFLETRNLLIPLSIDKLIIDTKLHYNNKQKEIQFYYNNEIDVIATDGIEMKGLEFKFMKKNISKNEPVLETVEFIYHNDDEIISLMNGLRLGIQLAIENSNDCELSIIEYFKKADNTDELLTPIINKFIDNILMKKIDLSIVHDNDKSIDNYDDDRMSSINIMSIEKFKNSKTKIHILVGNNILSTIDQFFMTTIKDNGFIMTIEKNNLSKELMNFIDNNNFKIIVNKKIDESVFLLLKKCNNIGEIKYDIVHVNNHEFSWIEDVKKLIEKNINNINNNTNNSRILLVSEKSYYSGLLGFLKCLNKEPGGDIVRGIIIQSSDAPNFDENNIIYKKQLNFDLIVNILRFDENNSKNKIWGSYRNNEYLKSPMKNQHHICIEESFNDNSTNFQWIQGPLTNNNNNKNLIKIIYSSINNFNELSSTDKINLNINDNFKYGFEYSGYDFENNKIMGLTNKCSLTNYLSYNNNEDLLVWKLPDKWLLEDAVTIPYAYSLSYLGFYCYGKIKKYDKILINNVNNIVGQSAIILALHEKCDIFITVETTEERDLIMKKYTNLKYDQIGYYTDINFENLILEKTHGKGVDIVFNLLSNDKLLFNCLSNYGKFININNINTNLSFNNFDNKKISFYSISLNDLLFNNDDNNLLKIKKVYELLKNGIDNDIVVPLNKIIFQREQINTAFNYILVDKQKTTEKILIKIQNENDTSLQGLSKFYCKSNCNYLVLGGLGGFGMELVNWLIERGAKYITITSRNGIKNGYQKMRIDIWKKNKININIITGKNVNNENDCIDIINETSNIAQIDGLFNLATEWNDQLLINHTQDTFSRTFTAKGWSTKIFDKLTRKMCPMLNYFVVFSSIVCSHPIAGSTNYSMANSIMERICEKRIDDKLPALAIQWGGIADVGLVSKIDENNQNLQFCGTIRQSIESCLNVFNDFMMNPYVKRTVVSFVVPKNKKIHNNNDKDNQLNIVDVIFKTMGFSDIKKIRKHATFVELGLDSILLTEIRKKLQEFNVFLTPNDIWNLTFDKLSSLQLTMSNITDSNATIDQDIHCGAKLLIKILGDEKNKDKICLELSSTDDVKYKNNHVILIPGAQGTGDIFQKLSSNINASVTCLQLENNNDDTIKSISKMATDLLPYVLSIYNENCKLIIVGYSYGSIIAIELARQLENKNINNFKLMLIDGAPDVIKSMNNEKLDFSSDDKLQTSVITYIMSIIDRSIPHDIQCQLDNTKSWNEKLKILINYLPQDYLNISHEYQENIYKSMYKRFVALKNYNPADLSRIKSSIVLLKPTRKMINFALDDYGLSKITQGKIVTHEIDGNHVSMLDNSEIAVTINNQLCEE